jgi:hypothetical protein
MKFEQVDMFAARMQAIIRPAQSRGQKLPACEPERRLALGQGRALLNHQRRHNQPRQRPPDRAEPLDKRAVGLAYAPGAFGVAGGRQRQHVRLGHNAHNAIDRKHGNGEYRQPADFAVQRKKMRRQTLVQSRKPAYPRQTGRSSITESTMIRNDCTKSV